jgi:anti-sigma B factor antagonist
MRDYFVVQAAHLDGHAEVRFVGELDMATAEYALTEAQNALAATPGSLIIDVSELAFCDSSGLHTFVRLQDAARSKGVDVVLRRPHPNVVRALSAAGLGSAFTIDDGAMHAE